MLGDAIYVSKLTPTGPVPGAGGSVVRKYAADGTLLTERVFPGIYAVTALDGYSYLKFRHF